LFQLYQEVFRLHPVCLVVQRLTAIKMYGIWFTGKGVSAKIILYIPKHGHV